MNWPIFIAGVGAVFITVGHFTAGGKLYAVRFCGRVCMGGNFIMKKTLIIVLIIILGSVGFLAYDWQVKTTLREDDQRVTLYSWTDENGARHYTNTQPPDGAGNIEERKGYKYSDQPLVEKIKDKTIDGYKWIKAKKR